MIDKRKLAKMFAVAFVLCPTINKILDISVILQDMYSVNRLSSVIDVDEEYTNYKEDTNSVELEYDNEATDNNGEYNDEDNNDSVKNRNDTKDSEIDIKYNTNDIKWYEDPFFCNIKSNTYNNCSDMDNEITDNTLDTNENNLQNLANSNTQISDDKTITETSISKINTFTNENLMDYDYLYNNFYTVDSTTTLSSELLNGKKLLEKDLTITKDSTVPQILILHTHSQEFFANSDESDISTGIVGVGDYLTTLLTNKGYNVIHDRSVYDYVDGVLDRNNAYTLATVGAENIIRENDSIEIVIDLHRDGISDETKHITSVVDGKEVAPVMLFNGISYTNKLGNIDYLYNPYIEDNLATSLQVKLKAEEYYPNVFRKIYIKGYRYVLHLKPRSMLIEAGFQTNTKEEVCNSMELLSEVLDMVFSK